MLTDILRIFPGHLFLGSAAKRDQSEQIACHPDPEFKPNELEKADFDAWMGFFLSIFRKND